ncbi:MarR family transcriptional regulator [Clostridiales bacterium F-3ap]|uniref:HTH-type transcriptional regulator SarZ n=1 Tax=Anaerotalea alkaliphila TaxID=2662126 RepID=A0A7X5HW36_9FIRM|nr:MarR family transcriptional regulator [Anaerotalea alkaliphila]
MSDLYESLNGLLVRLFNHIMTIEEKALIIDAFKDISITDMHVIEAIGYDTARNMSAIAQDLDVTVGTLTIAINNLVKKEYVRRVRSAKDKRVVLVSLLPKGQAAYLHHMEFHKEMVDNIIKMLKPEEAEVLNSALHQLERYFDATYKAAQRTSGK